MPPSPHPRATGVDTTSPSVTVVLPALDEEPNLPLVLENLPDIVAEVIVVDGGSTDDTVAVAREVRPDVIIVRQTRSGKGNALACGLAAATGDIVVTLNADGSTDPGEIPRYVDALQAGAEVAHGSRYRRDGADLDGSGWDRRVTRWLTWLVNLLLGTRFTDLGFGYNALWRTLVPALDLPDPGTPGSRAVWGDGPEIEPLINIRMATRGLRVVEVASVGYPRIHGARRRRPIRGCLRSLRAVLGELIHRRHAQRTPTRRTGAHAQPVPSRRTSRRRGGRTAPPPARRPVPPPRRAPATGSYAGPAGPVPDTGRHASPAGAYPSSDPHDPATGPPTAPARHSTGSPAPYPGADAGRVVDSRAEAPVQARPTAGDQYPGRYRRPAAAPPQRPGPTDRRPSADAAGWHEFAGYERRSGGERRQAGAARSGPADAAPPAAAGSGWDPTGGRADARWSAPRPRPRLRMIRGERTGEVGPARRPGHLRAVSGEQFGADRPWS